MADKKEYQCPRCGGTSFTTRLNMAQTWELGPDGVLERPVTDTDIDTQGMENLSWNCLKCGFKADGARFRKLSVKQKPSWTCRIQHDPEEENTPRIYERFDDDYFTPDNDSVELENLPLNIQKTAYSLIDRSLEYEAFPAELGNNTCIVVMADLVNVGTDSSLVQEAWAEKLLKDVIQTCFKGIYMEKTDFSAFSLPPDQYCACRRVVIAMPENTNEHVIRTAAKILHKSASTVPLADISTPEQKELRNIIQKAIRLSLKDEKQPKQPSIDLSPYFRQILEGGGLS